MEDKEKRYVRTKIDLMIEEHNISNKDFVDITDEIKIRRDWNDG